MILLESANVIIKDVLTEKFNKPSSLDHNFVDFDGVRYRLSTPQRKTQILLSMGVACWSELVQYGAMDVIRREYGEWLSNEVEPDYNVSLEFDLDKVPPLGEARDDLIRSVSLLKRNALAAPFERAFSRHFELEKAVSSVKDLMSAPAATTSEIMQIHYRDEEAIYIQASHDRVTVFFSTVFKEETDRILGKVFLQEFVDARKLPSIQNAPQVLYSNREPPLEIRGLPGLSTGEDMGYVTFVLFPRHFATPDVASSTISRIQLFRDYLHYHIKCSKAYMHSRMRNRVAEFLKVLNRAKHENAGEKEKKTITGRTLRTR